MTHFSPFSFSPQSATAPVLLVGVPQYPSVPCAQGGSSFTRVSVWRHAGRASTPRTTPATVRLIFLLCIYISPSVSLPFWYFIFPALRLSSILPFLCGTPGLRLSSLSQTGGSPLATVQSPPARRLHSWMSGTQLPGLHADMQRWVSKGLFFFCLISSFREVLVPAVCLDILGNGS